MKKNIIALIIMLLWTIVLYFRFSEISKAYDDLIIVPVIVNFVALLSYFHGDNAKFFGSIVLRFFYLLLIILNSVAFIAGMLLQWESIRVVHYMIISTIMFLIMLALIQRFFRNQINIDLSWHLFNIKRRLASNKNKTRKLMQSINDLKKISSKFPSFEKEFYEYGRLGEIINLLGNKQMNLDYESAGKKDLNNTPFSEICEIYSYIYFKLEESINYQNEIISTILRNMEFFYKKGFLEYFRVLNDEFLKIMEYDFSSLRSADRLSKQSFSSVKYLNEINKIYQNENVCNDVIKDSVNRIIILMRMYDFKLDEQTIILNIQKLIDSALVNEDNFNEKEFIDYIQRVMHLLNTQCIPRKLELFYNQMVIRIAEKYNHPLNIRVHDIIINIIIENDYNKTPLVYLVKNYADLVKEDKDESKTYTYFDFLAKLDSDQLYFLSLGSFFDYYLNCEESNDGRNKFAYNTFRKVLNNDEKANYVLYELKKYSENSKPENIIDLLNITLELLRVRGTKTYFKHAYIIYDELIEKVLADSAKSSTDITSRLELIVKSLDKFIQISDSDQVSNFVIDLMFEYLDNLYAHKIFIDRIMEIAYVSIEQGKSSVYRNISNKLGWNIYKRISLKISNEKEDTDSNSISKIFKHLVNFYIEVDTYQPNDSLFVGTAIVVNLTHVNRIREDYKENKKLFAYYNDLASKLYHHYIILDSKQKSTLSKSARIRKYSINAYVEGDFEENKKIINSIFCNETSTE